MPPISPQPSQLQSAPVALLVERAGHLVMAQQVKQAATLRSEVLSSLVAAAAGKAAPTLETQLVAEVVDQPDKALLDLAAAPWRVVLREKLLRHDLREAAAGWAPQAPIPAARNMVAEAQVDVFPAGLSSLMQGRRCTELGQVLEAAG